jgi:hypothetical protein
MRDENITTAEFNDFVGVWPGLMPKTVCKKFIDVFELAYQRDSIIDEPINGIDDIPEQIPENAYMTGSTQFENAQLGRDDTSLLLNYTSDKLSYECNQYLQACLQHYVSQYPQLIPVKMISTDIKMQKTRPGGGYHHFHYESSNWQCGQRELTWIIYLNDLPEGEGETEFLYQRRRIRPTAGTVVIWPAGMTHVHKGNTVLTQDKYILTGWYIKLP